MSTKKTPTKKGYEFTVQGKYYAENEHGKNSLKFYKALKFVLPEISTYVIGKKWEYYKGPDGVEKKRAIPNVKRQNTLMCYKYMIKNYYLDVKLAETYPEYIRFQTFQVTKKKEVRLTAKVMKEFSVGGPIEDMNEAQLIQFIAFKDLNVDLQNYFDLADKKIAVEHAVAEAASDRPGIDRPMTQEEKDLLPPEGVSVLRGEISSEDGIPSDDENEVDAFL